MVDVELLGTWFRAVDSHAVRRVFVGDHHQLPPIGPGRPFYDLIAANAIGRLDAPGRWAVLELPLSDLSHNYRVQVEGSRGHRTSERLRSQPPSLTTR